MEPVLDLFLSDWHTDMDTHGTLFVFSRQSWDFLRFIQALRSSDSGIIPLNHLYASIDRINHHIPKAQLRCCDPLSRRTKIDIAEYATH
jgi:hypothetical protein